MPAQRMSGAIGHHASEAICFLNAWVRYGEPAMRPVEQDRCFVQFATVAQSLGAGPVPRTRRRRSVDRPVSASAPCRCAHGEVDPQVLTQKAPAPSVAPFQRMVMAAAIDLLPGWARRMHGLANPALAMPAVPLSTFAIAESPRRALAQDRPRAGNPPFSGRPCSL